MDDFSTSRPSSEGFVAHPWCRPDNPSLEHTCIQDGAQNWHEGFILFTERLSKRSKKASQRQPGLILIA
jgi:hypothetical protein